jgi:hypothetical protein
MSHLMLFGAFVRQGSQFLLCECTFSERRPSFHVFVSAEVLKPSTVTRLWLINCRCHLDGQSELHTQDRPR